LTRAGFVAREKRFRVLVEPWAEPGATQRGEPFWVHTNNSGSMLGLLSPGRPVLLSRSDNPGRRLAHTLEMVQPPGHPGHWACVNTLAPNRVLMAAHARGLIPELAGYPVARREQRLGDSRLDGLFLDQGGNRFWVEAKNVTLEMCSTALFPDAPTRRGLRHLEELAAAVRAGDRAAMFFMVSLPAEEFAPARDIDPDYALALEEARARGVEIWAVRVLAAPDGLRLAGRLPLWGRAGPGARSRGIRSGFALRSG
jgi:sugar fermentation stimulation protein A